MPAPTDPAGIDSANITAWLGHHHVDLTPPLGFEQKSGGKSNLTFIVTDADDRRAVLRRPPTGTILASAHDMAREYRLISALGPTPVPVPHAIALCEDEDVTGATFYLMSFVAGTIVHDRDDAQAVDPTIRPRMVESLVATLAALHAVDPESVGLGDLGRPDGYVGRQLRRWKRQVDEGSDRHLPLIPELHRRLEASIPEQQGSGIVHGDYRLDNCMMSRGGQVAAVLDWELCTLGDVLSDVAGMVTYWGDDPEARGRVREMPTGVEGFGTGMEAAAIYASHSDRDLSDLPWYVAFQHWRFACILEGVRVRFEAGAMGEAEAHDEGEARAGIDYLLERARHYLDDL